MDVCSPSIHSRRSFISANKAVLILGPGLVNWPFSSLRLCSGTEDLILAGN